MMKKAMIYFRLLLYCFEALSDLIICRFLLSCFPFRFYAKNYGYAQCETLHENMSFAEDKIILIQKLFRKIPRFLPWKSKCLDQAMAAQRMLRRRRLQTTLYFGLTRNKNHILIAHAWLRCGDCWIVGYQPEMQYTIVGVYASIL